MIIQVIYWHCLSTLKLRRFLNWFLTEHKFKFRSILTRLTSTCFILLNFSLCAQKGLTDHCNLVVPYGIVIFGSAFDQAMDWRLLGANPFPEQMLTCQLDPKGKQYNSMTFLWIQQFSFMKMHLKISFANFLSILSLLTMCVSTLLLLRLQKNPRDLISLQNWNQMNFNIDIHEHVQANLLMIRLMFIPHHSWSQGIHYPYFQENVQQQVIELTQRRVDTWISNYIHVNSGM